jgi:hypothetical protein
MTFSACRIGPRSLLGRGQNEGGPGIPHGLRLLREGEWPEAELKVVINNHDRNGILSGYTLTSVHFTQWLISEGDSSASCHVC